MIIKPLDIFIMSGNWWNPLHWAIMWRSISRHTHCVIFKNSEGDIFDATIGGILNHNLFSYYKNRSGILLRYTQQQLTDKEIRDLLDWCLEKQVSCKGYDYISYLGFATCLKNLEGEDRFFCSELPYWMFQDNGYKLTNEDVVFILPCDLVRNPYFTIVWQGKVKDLQNVLTERLE